MNQGSIEDQLRLSQERYRYFVEQTAEGFYRLESEVPISTAAPVEEQVDLIYRHMFIAECNAFFARMYGHARPESMIGQRLEDLHRGPDADTNREALKEFIRSDYRVVDLETREPDESGVLLYLLNNAVGIRESGHMTGIWGTQRDVTSTRLAQAERQEFEESLKNSQRLHGLGLLAGGIAHDFNNLLTSIIGSADLAHLVMPEDDPAREHVDLIQSSAERAAALCKQLQVYSGGGRFDLRPTDVSVLAQEIVTILKATTSKKVEIRCEDGPDTPAVMADSAQLQQVIMNLITNGVEAIGSSCGTVTVRTEPTVDRDFVRITVSDDGCGMPEEDRDRVFDPFFSTKSSTEGRGLGLSAVQGIIQSHNGSIEVVSELGLGSTITVLLPTSELPVVVLDPEPPHVEARGSGLALVVDDEADVRTFAQRCLEYLGYEVVLATDGEQGLATFQERPRDFALVLVDVSMPRMDGIELYHELRMIRPDVPIVLSSGYDQNQSVATLPDHAGMAFLQKPYVVADLMRNIRAASVGARKLLVN